MSDTKQTVNKAWQECLLEAEKELRMPMSNSMELVELVNQVHQLAAEKYAVRVLQWANFTSEDHSKVMHQRFIEKKQPTTMKHQRIIEFRFILTPFATTKFTVFNVERKRYYIFGIKIIDLAI